MVQATPTIEIRDLHKRFGSLEVLKGVSMVAGEGDVISIIGSSGSGKSTLLQIIAGTLQPNEGEICVNGRIAALLELGSGFSPEFTGRENVYLNASLFGLSKQEIDQKRECGRGARSRQ